MYYFSKILPLIIIKFKFVNFFLNYGNTKKNSIFEISISQISTKYKSVRYARRDGNCFYRSFLYRLFEHCCLNNDKKTFAYLCDKRKSISKFSFKSIFLPLLICSKITLTEIAFCSKIVL
jgi:hypothetical protein